MKPVFLARLLRAKGMARCLSASVAVGFDLDVRDVSCLECQRQFELEENPGVWNYPCEGREVINGTLARTEECV
jgi:hypothetical protein